MATIIAGGPGDPEVTPEVNSGECASSGINASVKNPVTYSETNLMMCVMFHHCSFAPEQHM